MKNNVTEDKALQVTGANFAQKVQQWSENNSPLNLQENFAKIAYRLTPEFYNCLTTDQKFNQNLLLNEIKEMQQQIAIGAEILPELIQSTDLEIIKLKELIFQSMDRLDTSTKKLSNFFNKTNLIPQYKENTKKYKKDIEKTLSYLIPEKVESLPSENIDGYDDYTAKK